jgi:hypothetical protein
MGRSDFNYIYRGSENFGSNGDFNYFLIFIYRLKLNVKRLSTLDERVEMVPLSRSQGWTEQVADELQTVVLMSIPIC